VNDALEPEEFSLAKTRNRESWKSLVKSEKNTSRRNVNQYHWGGTGIKKEIRR